MERSELLFEKKCFQTTLVFFLRLKCHEKEVFLFATHLTCQNLHKGGLFAVFSPSANEISHKRRENNECKYHFRNVGRKTASGAE